MNVIKNKFSSLLDKKRRNERREITLQEVIDVTKIPRKTLLAWANNKVKRFDEHVIEALCNYFDVQPGDLFEQVPDKK